MKADYFIEVYKVGEHPLTVSFPTPLMIESLQSALDFTKSRENLRTVAIFKIKAK